MKKKEMPFEDLQQYVGPNGQGSKKPCPYSNLVTHAAIGAVCNGCHGTGAVLDTNAPLFKAMWEFQGDVSTGVGPYVPRSRADAALSLIEAARQIGGVSVWWDYDRWKALVAGAFGEDREFVNALCAALSARFEGAGGG